MLKYIDMLDNDKIDDTFKENEGKLNRVVAQLCLFTNTCDSGKVEVGLRKDHCAHKGNWVPFVLDLVFCIVT